MVKYDKKIWSWMLYDWAAQPYSTLLITFIFAPYFTSVVVGDPILGQSLWGMMTAVVGLSLAVLGPVLGAISDTSGLRKIWMAFFSFLYVLGAYSMWWAFPGAESLTVILVLFGIGMLGMELSQIFVNSMLPEICSENDIGRVSGNGWSLGYVGGLLLLFITLLFFAENNAGHTLLGNPPVFGLDVSVREGTRAVGPLTAIWYVLFMIPFFLFIPENKVKTSKNVTFSALRSLWKSIKKLPSNISLSSYLVSSMFYRDALVGIALFLTHLAKKDMSISALRASYPNYAMSKNKIQLEEGMDVDGILSQMATKYASLNPTTIDGVKIDFENEWVHLRKSNTEPIIRIYSEAPTASAADELAQRFMKELMEIAK